VVSERKHILYICHDGVIPPLGQSQVLNLLLELQGKGGLRFSLLSFEKEADLSAPAFHTTREKLEAVGISWKRLPYRRRPTGLATLFSVIEGAWFALRLHRRDPIRILHARSYVSAAIASLVKLETGIPFLFDMRGFWADEKLDVGTVTKTSLAYRAAKLAEAALLRHADVIASLSRAGVRELERWRIWGACKPRFEVVTTYANLTLFRAPPAPPAAPFTVGYVGTVHGSYLFDPFLEAFRILRRKVPEARLVVLNRYEREYLRARLAEFPSACVEIKAVEHDEVPRELGRMHAAIFFIRPTYAKLASAPTKLGELLACGVPCLTNSGVGDVEEILGASGTGAVVKGFSAPELEEGVSKLLALCADPGLRARCVNAAEAHFSLARGAGRYQEIYASL
jgi:glycosyltransferase involved in cell wall biosynthesis